MKNVLVGHKFNSIPSLINYTLLDKIGEGGHGYVYKAKQNSTGQVVAIKMLKFKENIDEQIRKRQVVRFERETQLCAEINHPNIVKLIDKGYTENKEVYAVYEYICGETLDEFIFKKKELTPVAISELMGQILEGLICAHTKGIVHRDLKPQNIMVNTNGSRYYIKILDFGIGTFTSDSQAQNSEKLTLTREIVGTPAYSAPEQLRGEPVTVKSDLYAWGLIFLECLTGQPVVKGGSLAELFQQQLSASNILVPATIAGHPLADLLRRVLEKKAEYRISSAEVVYEEYSKINFYSLVGELKQENTDSQSSEDITIANQFEWTNPSSHKRQITVVCIKLSLIQSQSSGIDLETLDTLQKDQLNLCVDTATRFGGYLAGKFTDHLMIYFGYPKVSDTDARRAGRTALELINQVQKRSTLLAEQHGISMSIRVSMNSGTVVSSRNSFPEGVVPNVAFNLVYIAKAGTILVSESTKKMLDPYLEFEATEACFLPNLEAPLSSYYLTGERKSEAFSFLRPWSAHRKMIGRDTELQQILKEWKIVTPQKGKAILIEGQAGIGKSKLLYECKINIEKEGYIVQECRCLPEHQNNALYPFLELLKKQLGIHTGMEDVVTVIPVLEQLLKDLNCDCATTMPVVCSWLSIPLPDTNQPSQETPERQKEILLVTLEKFLLRSKKYKKFVFVIEDLHWLDPTSQVFIEKMIGVASNCLLLMSIRPSNSVKLFSEKTHKISLQPLSDAVTKRFLEEMLHTTFITEEAIDYISNRADGVPLFIEELTQMLLSKNCLLKNDEMYKLAEKVDEKFIPVTLKGLLHARLDGLGLSKETAQLAATIGREFDYQLLIASSLQDEARVQTDLEVLIKANLIYQQRKVKGESYVFRHALIRDAAYDGMLTVYRREMHERVAKALEEESIKNNAQLLAFHFHQAKQPIKAIKYYQIAADQELQKKNGASRIFGFNK
ncbi:TOMM system kinase/cyclase fusion protein [Aquimarina aquimarini]|uniref:TOMM system kinase/cyclase fusion protein n=1 Tax=Aquimarina aquimarini TaxID=1191734 RepID=UPI001F2FC584|nr:TOMM system kinase/cyclase fusion protein [Aquimarina aquimarini]